MITSKRLYTVITCTHFYKDILPCCICWCWLQLGGCWWGKGCMYPVAGLCGVQGLGTGLFCWPIYRLLEPVCGDTNRLDKGEKRARVRTQRRYTYLSNLIQEDECYRSVVFISPENRHINIPSGRKIPELFIKIILKDIWKTVTMKRKCGVNTKHQSSVCRLFSHILCAFLVY